MTGDAMTEEQWIELGQRAFACKHWRWMPGMRAIEADTEMRQHGPAWGRAIDGLRGLEWFHAHGGCIEPVPDLRDPATVGCLLALVREAWGCHVHLRRWASPAPDMSGKDRSTWEPVDGLGRRLVAGPRVLCESEAAALVAALEAA